jgi:hypothetical protein
MPGGHVGPGASQLTRRWALTPLALDIGRLRSPHRWVGVFSSRGDTGEGGDVDDA